MENILEIKKLNLFFDKYQALYNVDLTLKKGVMEALVGESGCGKTVTSKAIMGLLPAQNTMIDKSNGAQKKR